MSLATVVTNFLKFLGDRVTKEIAAPNDSRDEIVDEASRYLAAVDAIQTGSHIGKRAVRALDGEAASNEDRKSFVANVRLINGSTRAETRHRLMLAFNTPFYPEILIASSVMAEGVDLHMNCRFVIHHDLSWNPSSIEQRTGRVDRIGAKAEVAGKPINVFLPFVAETQDERMFRVVRDRESWFQVVMGSEQAAARLSSAEESEKIASRLPLPKRALKELRLRLGLPEVENGELERRTRAAETTASSEQRGLKIITRLPDKAEEDLPGVPVKPGEVATNRAEVRAAS
jgi:superfamily II DNA/RNA helicase